LKHDRMQFEDQTLKRIQIASVEQIARSKLQITA